VNLFLEIVAGLCGANGTQFLDWGFQELGSIFFDLLTQPLIFESLEQCRILDMGESAAQWTFHNVIINHRQPRRLREKCGDRMPLSTGSPFSHYRRMDSLGQ
jgi:hypothetical protein